MERIKEHINESIETKKKVLEIADDIKKIADLVIECYKNKGKVVLFGNGGSAADAQHIAAEFLGKYKKERKALPAIALTTNASSLTAISNDFGFENVFAKQIEGLVNKDDVVIGISTSGSSINVINGLEKAKEVGAKTIALCGSGGKMKDIADYSICVPSENTPIIQESHIMIGHIICGLVEETLFP